MELSDEPVLGDWTISVSVLGQVTETQVLVAEHVLPKFEVVVSLPSYVTIQDEEITAVISARYINNLIFYKLTIQRG